MKKILITEKDFEKLSCLKQKEISEAYKIFRSRKKCHMKETRLKYFYVSCAKEFNPVLYTIPFNCYFSFYLYLFLKAKAEKFRFESNSEQFTVSKPMEINFSKIRRLTGIPMGTIKSAYRELQKFGFLIYTEELASEKKNESKYAMLQNDYYILEHDPIKDKTIFNIKLT